MPENKNKAAGGAAKLRLPEAGPAAREAIQALRGNLQLRHAEARVIGVTCAGACPGKAALALRLARSYARLDGAAAYIDADLAGDGEAKRCLGGIAGPGLSEYLRGKAGQEEVLHPAEGGALAVVPAGEAPEEPALLLSGKDLGALAASLRKGHVVVNLTSLDGRVEGLLAARACDGVVLAVASGATTVEQGQRAKRALEDAGIPVLGAVLLDGR